MVDLPNIRNITVSGRIGAGSTTLARALSEKLGWKHLEGGEIFWERVRSKLNLAAKDTNLRPDEEDIKFDEELKKILKEETRNIIEAKLAGFNAQGIDGIFKILVVCDDQEGKDQTAVRIDRLINREHLSIEEAKAETLERERNDIEKYRRLYAGNDTNWFYWDNKYYDLIINTYSHNPEESLAIAMEAIAAK